MRDGFAVGTDEPREERAAGRALRLGGAGRGLSAFAKVVGAIQWRGYDPAVDAAQWYLTAGERGNVSTSLDSRHDDGAAWTAGNLVRPLIHGASYFLELHERVARMGDGDVILFVDWRGDPDEELTGQPGSAVGAVLAAAAGRGVDVRGLVWRSHWDRIAFSASENRHLGEQINARGGEVVLDMRVRLGGSHHQKFVVLRHPKQPGRDVAFLGGIDLCHSRRDDIGHHGDRQRQAMAKVYGPTPPWHDVQLAIEGPAVGDVETVFRERWQDPQLLSRSPFRALQDRRRRDRPARSPLPPQLPDPPIAGPHPVQILRTYPRRVGGYPFAPHGERSVARAYIKAIGQARHLIYLEDQYLWSKEVAAVFAAALTRNLDLRLIAVLPPFPDQDGRLSEPPNLVSRQALLGMLDRAAPGRVAAYGLENSAGTPIYVHSKVCVIDDQWASVGSDNFNRRSWTHDSEASAAVAHAGFARTLREQLAQEHLAAETGMAIPLADQFRLFAESAARLEAWRARGRPGPRPPGQLRPLASTPVRPTTRALATAAYRAVYDPDGRPLALRLRRSF
ncbi:MAG TPA: phospholipase D family protein [Pedococcus sp.]|nr:phospholipase D family protein [Pedococcus sp.]